jgi:hypothetical protein
MSTSLKNIKKSLSLAYMKLKKFLKYLEFYQYDELNMFQQQTDFLHIICIMKLKLLYLQHHQF